MMSIVNIFKIKKHTDTGTMVEPHLHPMSCGAKSTSEQGSG